MDAQQQTIVVFMDIEHIKRKNFSELLPKTPIKLVLTSMQKRYLENGQSDIVMKNCKWCLENPDRIEIIEEGEEEGGNIDFITSFLSKIKRNVVWIWNSSVPLSLIQQEYSAKNYPYNNNGICSYSMVKPELGVSYKIDAEIPWVYRLIRGIKETNFITKYDKNGERYVAPIKAMRDEPKWIKL